MRPSTTVVLALTLAACRPPDPAPTELDELAHFFLTQAHVLEHERILEGAANLARWFDDQGLAGPGAASGSLSDLSPEEVGAFDELTWQPDPAPAVGVFALSELDCSLGEAEAVNLHEDQLELFPDSYRSYARSYERDPSCYLDGACDAVDWVAQIEDGFVGGLGTMTYRVVAKLRRSRDEAGTPGAMLVRSVMPEPAAEEYDAGGYEQSYHVGVYIPRGEGRSLHLSALWSHGWVNGVDEEADLWANQYVGGLLDFEENMQTLCVEGW